MDKQAANLAGHLDGVRLQQGVGLVLKPAYILDGLFDEEIKTFQDITSK